MVRFVQGATFIAVVAGLALTVAITSLTVTDLFASILAFVPTGWGILCVSCLKFLLGRHSSAYYCLPSNFGSY